MPDARDWASPDDRPLFRVGLLSDVHFGNASLRERQNQALSSMDALGLRLLVLMGDNVDNALGHQYAVARTALRGLDTPILAISGNHELFPQALPVEDCLAHFRHAYGQVRHYTARLLPPYFFVFLGIDARRPHLPKNRRDTGLSDAQLQWFQETLQQHGDRPTVIVSHAPLEGTVADSDHFPLADSPRLREILAKSPQVILWLSGHTHLPDVFRGNALRTAVEPEPGRFFVHVPSVADYFVHVIDGQRQFFRGLPLKSRLLSCFADRIEVETFDPVTGTCQPFVTVPVRRPTFRAA